MPKTVTCVDIDGNTHEVSANQLSWRPSVYAIVIKDNALLVSPQFNGYDLPGGGMDIGELPEQTATRETKEETGIDVVRPQIVGATSSLFKAPHTDKDEFMHSIMLYYVCEYVGGKLSTEGFDEYEKEYARMPEWLPLDKLDGIAVASSIDWRQFVRKVTA